MIVWNTLIELINVPTNKENFKRGNVLKCKVKHFNSMINFILNDNMIRDVIKITTFKTVYFPWSKQ